MVVNQSTVYVPEAVLPRKFPRLKDTPRLLQQSQSSSRRLPFQRTRETELFQLRGWNVGHPFGSGPPGRGRDRGNYSRQSLFREAVDHSANSCGCNVKEEVPQISSSIPPQSVHYEPSSASEHQWKSIVRGGERRPPCEPQQLVEPHRTVQQVSDDRLPAVPALPKGMSSTPNPQSWGQVADADGLFGGRQMIPEGRVLVDKRYPKYARRNYGSTRSAGELRILR